MTTGIDSIVGKLMVLEPNKEMVPLINVVGEDHQLVPVQGKYHEKATEIAKEVKQQGSLLIKTGCRHTQGDTGTTYEVLGQSVQPGDSEYPDAVAQFCQQYGLFVEYEPNDQKS